MVSKHSKQDGGALLLIGAYPPPVHGLANVNLAVLRRAHELNLKVFVVNTSLGGRQLSSILKIGTRLVVWLNSLFRILSILSTWKISKAYIGISGGWGQVNDLTYLIIARLMGIPIIIHHHSYSYIDSRTWLMKCVVLIVGKKARHVLLSPIMASRFGDLYRCKSRVSAISNSAFIEDEPRCHGSTKKFTSIGILSNLSIEKGVSGFLEIAKALRMMEINVCARLAGPISKSASEEIKEAIETGLAIYSGPVYGIDKKKFLSSIDVFVFPTIYVNEAEPLVLHEALSHGLPVIASNRGCIAEILGSTGVVIDRNVSNLQPALAQLKIWFEEPEKYQFASLAASARFVELKEQSRKQKQEFEDLLYSSILTS